MCGAGIDPKTSWPAASRLPRAMKPSAKNQIEKLAEREFGAEASRPPPLVQRTMRRLLRDILAGVYGPGDRIREVEVAQRLGVSRAPVREALRLLEQDGLVEVAPWRGARVINPHPPEIADLFDLLGTVYGAVARFAVRHASDAQLEQFYADIAQLAARAKDGKTFIDLVDVAYQMGTDLGQCCGNRLAAEMLRKLGRLSYLQHRFLQPVPARWRQQAVTRLRRLETAMRSHSEDRSERAARKLIQHTATLVVRRAQAGTQTEAVSKPEVE
jgi:DNA-binding GntR family transcriptional regulator